MKGLNRTLQKITTKMRRKGWKGRREERKV